MSWRGIAVTYLVAQGIGAIAWWWAILFWPGVRLRLIPESIPVEQFRYLLPPDAILFIGGSFLSAAVIWQRRRWAAICMAVHAGAAWYAGALAWTVSVRTGSGWISALLMLAPIVVLPCLLWRVKRDER